jgi:hypothetical protein
MTARLAGIAALAALGLSGCNSQTAPVVAAAPAPAPARTAPGPVIAGPLLGPDGRCTGIAPESATAIEPGIGECELVRLKGRAPTDVLVG